MAKTIKPINQDSKPWEIVKDCVSQAENTDNILTWSYIQEFLRKHHLILRDDRGKKIISLTEGSIIPGTNKQVVGTINAPIDPHITTLANGVTAKAFANLSFLMPQVNAATGEDEDQDAAVNSSHLLMYYHKALEEEELYKKIVRWFLPAGNAYIKDYWDIKIGDYIIDPLTQIPIVKKGKQLRAGDITSKINPPQKMLIPGGMPDDDNLPWIGEENAMPVSEIKEIWGIDVKEEGNLEDLNSLTTNNFAYNNKQTQLTGHARVREIYFKPSEKYPNGRLIIACNEQVLFDGAWDKALTEKYPDEWNPYTHVGYLKIEGDYWYKTLFEYLVDHQIQLNKVYKQIMDSIKRLKGCWISRQGEIDWGNVNWDAEGFVRIEFSQAATAAPIYTQIVINIQQLMGVYNSIIQRMNDIASNYEVSRGNNIPNVKSGRQVEALQAANSLQASPLLNELANGFIKHWRKVLRLCAVHYEEPGRLIKITGEENEAISFSFTPDQIKSDDITIANGPWFFMDPMQRMAELDRLYQIGALGNPADPRTQKRYAYLRGIGGGLEDVYADLTADTRMAKAENHLFKTGDLLEHDQVLISQNPIMQGYLIQSQRWQAQSNLFNSAVAAMKAGEVTPEQQSASPPPANPGPVPIKPTMYRLARPYDDHTLHISVHSQFMKSAWFEKTCLANPTLRMALDFHLQTHKNYLAQIMPQQPIINQGRPNIQSKPPVNTGTMGA